MDDDIDSPCFALQREAARIVEAARKHGISDADILHALAHLLRHPVAQDHEKLLVIGAAQDGSPLELIVVKDGDTRVIHAMKARRNYWP